MPEAGEDRGRLMVARLVAFRFWWFNVFAGFEAGKPGVDALVADVFAGCLEFRPAFQCDAVEFRAGVFAVEHFLDGRNHQRFGGREAGFCEFFEAFDQGLVEGNFGECQGHDDYSCFGRG